MIRYVDQSYEIITPLTPALGEALVKNVELTARICYQSESKTDEINEKLIHRLIKSGHHAMFEHGSVQVHITTSRAIANEITRHRMASYAQASTRYIKYNKRVDIVRGGGWDGLHGEYFDRAFRASIDAYHMLLNAGVPAEHARDVLPLALATQLMVTANLREWMHIFRQRTDPAAHPDMQALMGAILEEFRANIPIIYDEKYRNYWS
jgi:thymidylate synthase (FAD)